jgi:hypothetical protein
MSFSRFAVLLGVVVDSAPLPFMPVGGAKAGTEEPVGDGMEPVEDER